jgi:hypothetical protein
MRSADPSGCQADGRAAASRQSQREIVAAVRQAIPDASSKQPGQVLEFVLNALRMAEAKTIDCP